MRPLHRPCTSVWPKEIEKRSKKLGHIRGRAWIQTESNLDFDDEAIDKIDSFTESLGRKSKKRIMHETKTMYSFITKICINFVVRNLERKTRERSDFYAALSRF